MSALAQKLTSRHRLGYVRFASESGHRELTSTCPLSAKRRHSYCSKGSYSIVSFFEARL
jgi:hypothetical protein